jgi:hypothetical protein
MTDDTPTIPAAIVCDVEGCHVLVPDTLEDRREHRQGHKHEQKVEEAIRRALRELRADFDTLRGETRDRVKEIRDEVAGIDRAVGQIEIPEPVAPLTIVRGAWDDDDDAETSDEAQDDDWGFRSPEPEDEDDPEDADGTSSAGHSPDAPVDVLTAVPTPADVRPVWAR